MRKTSLFICLISFSILFSCSTDADKYLEAEAIAALDATTKTIGDMTSCSLRITTNSTEKVDGEIVSHVRLSDIYMRGGDKLFLYSTYDDVRKGFWYNGSELATFRFNEATYDVTKAPSTTIAMIDSINKTFKIDFPAADVFYPTLTDDLITNFDSIYYLGTEEANDVMCKVVVAVNPELRVVLYLDDATNLPAQLEIYGKGQSEGKNYFSFYDNWQVDPNLPDEMFKFSPPSNSTKAQIFKKD